MKKSFIFLSIALLTFISCGPSKESENKAWEKNLEAAKNLKTDYPVFSAFIDSKIDEATKLWNDAAGISDEDQKLKKMVDANDVIEEGSIGNLMHMKSKIADLKTKKEGLMKLKTPDEQLESRTQTAFTTVADAIKTAEAVLYMSNIDFNINDAPGKIDQAWNGLNDAYREVEVITNSINAENKSITDEKTKNEQQVTDEKLKAEEAAKDVKCAYCGVLNSADFTKCKSCGAPREK